MQEQEDSVKMWPVIQIIFKSKKLVLRFVIIYFIWLVGEKKCLFWETLIYFCRAVNAFVFYGLSVNSTSMSGNKYVNFALVSLIEIPGYTLAWVSIRKLGRRLSLVFSLLVCGLTCTLSIFVPAGL